MEKAIGMVELNSIARGIHTADQMLKKSEVEVASMTTTCPGKYISIVHGSVEAVRESVAHGIEEAEGFLVDHIVIPNVHPGVFPAIVGAAVPEDIQAIGILESFSLAGMIIAADAVLKVAELKAIEIRLGTGLGGKAFFVFTGEVADVRSGIEAGRQSLAENGLFLNAEIIPSPDEKLIPTLL